MARIKLGKSLRIADLSLLSSRSFHSLLDCIRSDDADLSEVKRLIEEAQSAAIELLRKNLDKLHKLAQELMKREVMTGDEIKGLLGLS